MAFRHFRFQVILRVVFLAITMVICGYAVVWTSLVATSVLLAALVIYQIWSLIRFVERTNQQLTRFLEAIRHQDFSQSFVTLGLGRSFEGLSAAFMDVANDFRKARAEKEEQYRYLQTLVEHIGVGVIAFRDNGDVELINHAAKRILNINFLRNIDRLEELEPTFPRTLRELEAGKRALVKVTGNYDTLQLAVHATKIRRDTESLTLVSVQNIGSELAEQEMAAWQNLIRVLTHEIMNSITPIASLAGSVNNLVGRELASQDFLTSGTINSEVATDLAEALTTIEKRSQGLLHFVDAYRNLTRIPAPQFRFVSASELIGRVQCLLEEQLRASNISFSVETEPSDLELAVDPDLIEQVLINLVLNSIHALDSQEPDNRDAGSARPGSRKAKAIVVRARIDRSGKTVIEVIDNGAGIAESALDKVFIPFFTTKKGGTGIGLALARQIMRLHKGNISVRSTPGEYTCFSLSF